VSAPKAERTREPARPINCGRGRPSRSWKRATGGNGVCPAGGEHQPRAQDYKLILLR
jgi:hypothetical protein